MVSLLRLEFTLVRFRPEARREKLIKARMGMLALAEELQNPGQATRLGKCARAQARLSPRQAAAEQQNVRLKSG